MVYLEFGFLPIPFDVHVGSFEIQSHANLDGIRKRVIEDQHVYKDWFFAPRKLHVNIMTNAMLEIPAPSRIFGLPATHSILLSESKDIARVKFILWALSLFLGVRLTSEERGFLDATPIKPHKLIDAYLHHSSYSNAVKHADDFYLKYHANNNLIPLVQAAIHTYFLAQYVSALPFERFSYLYASLDALYRATCLISRESESKNHAGRIQWLCEKYSLTTPSWAIPETVSKRSIVSELRNSTFHEGLFNGEPLGFRILDGGSPANIDSRVTFEMTKLTSRILTAVIAGSSIDYVKSPVDCRLYQSLRFP